MPHTTKTPSELWLINYLHKISRKQFEQWNQCNSKIKSISSEHSCTS